VDIWAAGFWMQVGESLGAGMTAAAVAVPVGVAVLLWFDVRRQWLLAADQREDAATPEPPSPSS
jgi:hypothetical protein